MVKGFDPRVSWLYLVMGLGSAWLAAVAYLATIKCRETDSPVGIVRYFHLIATPIMGTLERRRVAPHDSQLNGAWP